MEGWVKEEKQKNLEVKSEICNVSIKMVLVHLEDWMRRGQHNTTHAYLYLFPYKRLS